MLYLRMKMSYIEYYVKFSITFQLGDSLIASDIDSSGNHIPYLTKPLVTFSSYDSESKVYAYIFFDVADENKSLSCIN